MGFYFNTNSLTPSTGSGGGGGGSADTITAINKTGSDISAGDKVWLNRGLQKDSGQVGNGASVFYPMVSNGNVGYSGYVYSIDDLSAGTFTQLYSVGYYYTVTQTSYLQPYRKNPVLLDNEATYISLGASSAVKKRSWDMYSSDMNGRCVTTSADGFLYASDGTHVYKIEPNALTVDETISVSQASSQAWCKSGSYLIKGQFNSSHPEWTYVYDMSGVQQNDWTITGDTSVDNVYGAFAVTDSLYIVAYATSQSSNYPNMYTKNSNGYGANGIALMVIDSANKTVNFKTTSLTGGLANWTNNVSGRFFVTYNANCNTLCLAKAETSTPTYALFKYENGSWSSISLDLTGVLPSSNYFTSGISISDDGQIISFGYGSSSSNPAYNANRSQVICTVSGVLQYSLVAFASATQNSYTGVATQNIAVSSNGSVKTVLS